jgi:penicillin-binding protein 1A
MRMVARILAVALSLALTLGVLFAVVGAGIYAYIAPQVPDVTGLQDVQLQEPLRIYSSGGRLIAEFGEMHRTPVAGSEIPERVVQAFLAAEDNRFFEHPGVDYQGLVRAVVRLVRSGEKRHGGSTITMQLARNFFLTREKTFERKFAEILLALRIEQQLDKQTILQLYLNKIFFGHRAYGIAAAARVYYDKSLADLTVAEAAMLAGLPKAPSRFNPIANPQRALERRDYILRRMHELSFITEGEFRDALAEQDRARLHGARLELEAPYVAEMVRAEMLKRYGDSAYTAGYRVFTSIDERLQKGATAALRIALRQYDERHGYRGPEQRFQLSAEQGREQWRKILEPFSSYGGLQPALVVRVQADKAWVYLAKDELRVIESEGVDWARRYITVDRRGAKPEKPSAVLKVGDLVRIEQTGEDGARLAQIPAVEGALVALAPADGAILALVGGFDFYRSKFNRAVDARRQPGSSFKPFIYSAALERGLSPASIVIDEPRAFRDGANRVWRPKNYDGRYVGPVRVRNALTFSRNLASIDLLRKVGVEYASDYARRFGFRDEAVPRGLSIALGSGVVSPLELASAYAVFANGGFRIQPYLTAQIEDAQGSVLFRAAPARACVACEFSGAERGARSYGLNSSEREWNPAPRVTNARNVYQMNSMLADVIRQGTGRRARVLGRNDIAGKTGTTNDQRDAWFSGFQKNIVATAWVGFDGFEPLGRRETGSRAALPMWIELMKVALEGKPEAQLPMPGGLVTVSIDRETGQLTSPDDPYSVQEIVREENWQSLFDHRAASFGGELGNGVLHEIF